MRHGTARRLLASLPDGTLPEREELDLRVHVASCARCRQRLREMELAEALMRRLPVSLLPMEATPRSAARLESLARWSPDPYAPDPERWRAPALGLAGALAVLVLGFTVGTGSHMPPDTPERIVLASLYPGNSAYLPGGWSSGAF